MPEDRQFTLKDVYQAFEQYVQGAITISEFLLILMGYHCEQQVLAANQGACYNCGRHL